MGEARPMFVAIDHDSGDMIGRTTPRKIYLFDKMFTNAQRFDEKLFAEQMQKMESVPWKALQTDLIPIIATVTITLIFLILACSGAIFFCRRKNKPLKTEQSAVMRNTMTETPMRAPEPFRSSRIAAKPVYKTHETILETIEPEMVDRKTNEDQSRTDS